jgi:serine protease
MKRLAFVSLIIILLFACLPCLISADDFKARPLSVSSGMAEYVPGEVVVKFKGNISQKAIASIHAKMGTKVFHNSSYGGFQRVKVPKGQKEAEMVRIFRKNPAVEYSHLNYICHAAQFPNDPFFSYQWHFPLIDMEMAWSVQQWGNPDITLAVIDTGVAYEVYEEFIDLPGRRWDHWVYYGIGDDLLGTNFVLGHDFINNDDHPNDDNGHGTHVTGTAVQTTDNGHGVAGMAYGTSIIPIKVLGSNASGPSTAIADGIYYAANSGADIINMSLLFDPAIEPEDIPSVTAAVASAYDQECIMVASSGNFGVGIVSLPARYPEVIAVGAVHSGDERTSYSQYGPGLEVVAPGGDEWDRDGNGWPDGVPQETFDRAYAPDYTHFGLFFYWGTSMAAPHVSGLVALLLAQDDLRTLADIRDILHNTSVDLGPTGYDPEYGYGRIDAYAALQYTPQPPVADFVGTPTSGDAPLTMQFTDQSTGAITSWAWDFGDSSSSNEQNPSHTYTTADTYTVSLTVTGPSGSDTETKAGYINVTEAPANTMHVGNIDMALSTRTAGKKNSFTKALATITIVDSSNVPVEGATVNASWSNATSDLDFGITSSGGTTTLTSDEVKNAAMGTTFTITVDGVDKPGWTYDLSANIETSDSITVP